MKVNVKSLSGSWKHGHALDKHIVSSTYIGDNEQGHPQFDTVRTDVGEATFQLKYRHDWSQVAPLAKAVVAHGIPSAGRISAVVPMPASTVRARQPVTEVATAVARILNVPLLSILVKAPTPQLKNVKTFTEKEAILRGTITAAPAKGGPHHVLLIDDLFHTGASMEAAYEALMARPEIDRVTVVALTWR
ncbi:MAG: ComF family protein [Pseudomonadota bacterium]